MKRRFLNNSLVPGNDALDDCYGKGYVQTKGLPSVNHIAEELNVSSRYLSDLLKRETGKTVMDLIHISLISEAKNRLRGGHRGG